MLMPLVLDIILGVLGGVASVLAIGRFMLGFLSRKAQGWAQENLVQPLLQTRDQVVINGQEHQSNKNYRTMRDTAERALTKADKSLDTAREARDTAGEARDAARRVEDSLEHHKDRSQALVDTVTEQAQENGVPLDPPSDWKQDENR